ncbi:FliH/SctL family protein [Paenarthrobacter sp. NPDC089675]|uniref:FliH/SctL family protein n=1 Tax=Paenarthrobacter sp. NPDC089675 TaxID=3364376 RepID=UPI00382335B2
MSTESYTPVTFPTLQSADPAKDRGYTQGHAAGYAAGMRAAAAEQRRLREQLQAGHAEMLDAGRSAIARAVAILAAASDAAHRRQEVAVGEVEDVLASSALELAEAILGYELAHGDRTARAALDRALGQPGATVTTVRLHPGDLATLEAADVVLPAGVELKADPTLNPGDAVGEYPQGWIDARLASALERTRQALLGDQA